MLDWIVQWLQEIFLYIILLIDRGEITSYIGWLVFFGPLYVFAYFYNKLIDFLIKVSVYFDYRFRLSNGTITGVCIADLTVSMASTFNFRVPQILIHGGLLVSIGTCYFNFRYIRREFGRLGLPRCLLFFFAPSNATAQFIMLPILRNYGVLLMLNEGYSKEACMAVVLENSAIFLLSLLIHMYVNEPDADDDVDENNDN